MGEVVIDFLGARYYLFSESVCNYTYKCQRYKNPTKGSKRTSGFWMFQHEIRPRLKGQHSELSSSEITKLAGEAWRALPADQRDYYDRRASESGLTTRMQERCPGGLRFRTANGRMQLSVEGLVDYVPHSEECEFHPTNSRLEVATRVGAEVTSSRDNQQSDEASDLTAAMAAMVVNGSDDANGPDGSSEPSEFGQADEPELYSGGGVPLKVVYEEYERDEETVVLDDDEEIGVLESASDQRPVSSAGVRLKVVYEEYKRDEDSVVCEGDEVIVVGESASDQRPASPSPSPNAPEIECILIDA